MRALSVRVNDVVGVAGYVLPGTRVDVVATVNPTQQQTDVTSKVILTNVLVLDGRHEDRAATPRRASRWRSASSRCWSIPSEAERLTLASTEGKIQLALRNPLDKTAPATDRHPAGRADGLGRRARPRAPPRPRPAAQTAAAVVAAPAPLPTVEIIRGDKRAQEVVR